MKPLIYCLHTLPVWFRVGAYIHVLPHRVQSPKIGHTFARQDPIYNAVIYLTLASVFQRFKDLLSRSFSFLLVLIFSTLSYLDRLGLCKKAVILSSILTRIKKVSIPQFEEADP